MVPTAQPAPAPIHDIAGPVSYLPYPVWAIAVAAGLAVAILAAAAWFLFFRRRPAVPITARQRAEAALAALRERMSTSDPYSFAVEISDVLRRFIEEEFGIPATTQTSIEFLEMLRASPKFSDDERASLSNFLDKADLIKFARSHAAAEDVAGLLARAHSVVAKPPIAVENREAQVK